MSDGSALEGEVGGESEKMSAKALVGAVLVGKVGGGGVEGGVILGEVWYWDIGL